MRQFEDVNRTYSIYNSPINFSTLTIQSMLNEQVTSKKKFNGHSTNKVQRLTVRDKIEGYYLKIEPNDGHALDTTHIRCVRLICQPTSQQYCSLRLNHHQPPATSQSAVLFSHNKSTSAISHSQTNTAVSIQALKVCFGD